MFEEIALRQPSGVAKALTSPEDVEDTPTLDRVRDASSSWRRDGRSVATGDVTADAYERHAGEIHGFLLRIVRDPDAAADLVAEAFTKLLIEERAGRTPLEPRPWLYRVASNLATSRGRRLQATVRRTLRLQRQATRELARSPEDAVLDRERHTDLGRALETLSAEQRAAVLLAAQGYDGAAIAAMIGRSHGATRTMMCRARRRLRVALQEADA